MSCDKKNTVNGRAKEMYYIVTSYVTIDGVWISIRIYCTLQPFTTESLWTLYS
jgi:hypothetical protein